MMTARVSRFDSRSHILFFSLYTQTGRCAAAHDMAAQYSDFLA
jgi:hypothetical protein